MKDLNKEANNALNFYDRFSYDTETITQDELDLSEKVRTSLFSWRGQFSPQLVELFLEKYAGADARVLDPFAGMGTTLFECARKDICCFGTEINPAAFEMAKTVGFCHLSTEDRAEIIGYTQTLVNHFVDDFYKMIHLQSKDEQSVRAELIKLIKNLFERTDNIYAKNIMVNCFIRSANGKELTSLDNFICSFKKHCRIILDLPFTEKRCNVFLGDAREVPIEKESIDLVITSPPYINVFNYHQNHRPVMEMLGWNLLHVAKSEFGSNRKNRGNRFLTVIQYAVDMLDTMIKLRTLLKRDGRVIIVVGRESKIRGVSFLNGRLVSAIAVGGAGFTMENLQERKFKNKFGQVIYEDIIHLVPNDNEVYGENFAREITKIILMEAKNKIEADSQLHSEIFDAINRIELVQKSPILSNCYLPY